MPDRERLCFRASGAALVVEANNLAVALADDGADPDGPLTPEMLKVCT